MTAHIIIRIKSESPETMEWLSVDDDGLIESQGITTIHKLPELFESWQGKPLQLLVPGEQCTSILEHIPAKSQQQIRAALPYSVEDNFAEDIDQLHFAIGDRSAQSNVSALAVNKQQMKQWIQAFDKAGITPKLVTADHQALPKLTDACLLFVSDKTSLLRLKDGRSFSIDNTLLSLMLQQFGYKPTDDDESEEVVLDKLLILGVDINEKSELVQQLTQSLESSWDIQCEGGITQAENSSTALSELLYLSQNLLNSSSINLLQGEFKRRTPASKNWLMWKWPAVTAIAVVVLFLSILSLDYFSLKSQLANLKEAQSFVYKQAFPQEKTVIRPVSQMRGKLRLQGTTTEIGLFFPLLKKLSKALEKVNATEITNINFRSSKGVIKIDFLAPDFASIQQLQDELKAQKLIVTPGASNASGDQFFGRLTIKDGS